MCSPTFYLCLLSYLRTNLKLKKCQKVSKIRADLTALFCNGASMVSAQERLDSALVRVFWRCGYFPRNPCGRLSSGYQRKKNILNVLAIQWDHEGKIKYDAIMDRDHPKTRASTANTPTSFQSRSGMLMTQICKGPMKRPLKRSQKDTSGRAEGRLLWPCQIMLPTSWILLSKSATRHLGKEEHSILELNRGLLGW